MSVSIRGLMVPTKLRSGDAASYLTVATNTGRPGTTFSAVDSWQPVSAITESASSAPVKSLK